MHPKFSDLITTEAQLRELIGQPSYRAANKAISTLDEHVRAFIGKSPFMLIASSDSQGHMDVSPKGDPPGFVQVLDDQTLAIPDRPGNRRADTFSNILQNPQVALLFLVPGRAETVRVSGKAKIVRDLWLREQMAFQGKVPDFAVVVAVQEAFFHCAKCVVRSGLWDEERWPEIETLPTLGRILVDHAKLLDSPEELQATIDKLYQEQLY
jgi:PPOX class probable FMN-dependent enzyme